VPTAATETWLVRAAWPGPVAQHLLCSLSEGHLEMSNDWSRSSCMNDRHSNGISAAYFLRNRNYTTANIKAKPTEKPSPESCSPRAYARQSEGHLPPSH